MVSERVFKILHLTILQFCGVRLQIYTEKSFSKKLTKKNDSERVT